MGSVSQILLYYNFHWALARLVCYLHPQPDNEVPRFLEKPVISRDVVDFLWSTADPFSAIMVMQAATTTTGMATELWIELLERTPRSSPMYNLLATRAEALLTDPVALLGNTLDPRLRGVSLTCE